MTTRPDSVNILLVDDQPSKLLTYETILGELGEQLITANSATSALECLLHTDVAVVLVDVCMPDCDGYELATLIRQHPRFQQTAIIFVSAILLTDLDRLRGYECGAVDYVPVPVVPEILRAKVSVFAELYRKTRALERLNAELEARVAARTAALEASTAALQEADQRKDEFIAMLAHELRNPLAPIRTAVHLLRREELGDAQRDRAEHVIERQVDHLVRLIDDLLDVSRITRGMITLRRQPVLLTAVVARAAETMRPSIDARRQQLTIEIPDDRLTVDGDETRLVQVVGNLLHNASKFTGTTGRILVRVTRESEHAAILVKDWGVGIPSGSLSGIFDLFTRVPSRSESGQSGLGIGLALVKRLAEMHEGSVTAASDGPENGSEFVVRLPISAVEVIPGPEGVAMPTFPRQSPRRILVADDNQDAAESLGELLTLGGHDVRLAGDGAEALDIAKAFEPHIVLLDLGMPKMDGYETARHIRGSDWGRHTTLVAITGWGQAQDRQKTADAGFDLHLVKPVSDCDLFQALEVGASERKRRAANTTAS